MLSIRNALKYKNSDKLKVKGMDKDIPHWSKMKAQLAIFTLNKAYFRAREIIRDKDGHNIIIRHNRLVYAPNKKASKKHGIKTGRA